MAKLEKQKGFTSIDNEIIEHLAKINLSACESRVLWAIIRKTYGWHKPGDWISHSQFMALTGLDKRNAMRALHSLIDRNIIACQPVGKLKGYGLSARLDLWH